MKKYMKNNFTPSDRQKRFIEVFNDAKERHKLTNRDMEDILGVHSAQISMALGANPTRGLHVKHMDKFFEEFDCYSKIYVFEGKGDMFTSNKDNIIESQEELIKAQGETISAYRSLNARLLDDAENLKSEIAALRSEIARLKGK